MTKRVALLVASNSYLDSRLAGLVTPAADVSALAATLRAAEIGAFDSVVEIVDEPASAVRRAIARFFQNRKRDDLLLLYFSGHGIRDDQGDLHLAVKDTEHDLLSATAIPAAFVTEQMNRSHSRSQVLILDCCHSGAFARGAKGVAAGESVGTATAFKGNGQGRVVLTASDSTQYAWEGESVMGEQPRSVFTQHLVQGLRTGEADTDGDGRITLDELYSYLYDKVLEETPKQTPGKWAYNQQGDITIAYNPRPVARPAPLPIDLQRIVKDVLPSVREAAVRELAQLLIGEDRPLSLTARAVLETLTEDDSRRVALAAREALSRHAVDIRNPDGPSHVTVAIDGSQEKAELQESEFATPTTTSHANVLDRASQEPVLESGVRSSASSSEAGQKASGKTVSAGEATGPVQKRKVFGPLTLIRTIAVVDGVLAAWSAIVMFAASGDAQSYGELMFGASAAASLVSSIGLWRVKRFAFRLQIVLAAVGWLVIPVGPVVSLLTLISFRRSDVKALFSGNRPPASTGPVSKEQGVARRTSVRPLFIAVLATTLVLVVAAIAIPSLLRARIAANEAATIGDLRALLSAQVTYAGSIGGFYDKLECLATPSICIPGYAGGASGLIEAQLLTAERHGYSWTFVAGPKAPMSSSVSRSSITSFAVAAVPLVRMQTGFRSFCVDTRVRACGTNDSAGSPASGAACSSSCYELK